MIRKRFAYSIVLAAVWVGFSAVASAHHSAVAFDKERTVTVSGEVTRFVWRNPHMAINMEVTNDSGEMELWKIEGPGTTVLSRQGFNRSSINNGDQITVVVNPLKIGRPGGLLTTITLADGTRHTSGERFPRFSIMCRRPRARPGRSASERRDLRSCH